MNALDLPEVKVPVKYSICSMCSEKNDYKTLYEESLKTIDLLEFRIEQMHLKDSCYNILSEQELDRRNIKSEIRLLEKSKPNYFTEVHDIVMVTITFDPRKFPVLINRTAQRDYIRYVLDRFIDLFKGEIDYIYGCYELHDSGIVHTHFLIEKFDDHMYRYLQKQFTNDKNNDKAVHRCMKHPNEGYEYINKQETKDRNNMQNFYLYVKPQHWGAEYHLYESKVPTQEQLYEKFKKINNYII